MRSVSCVLALGALLFTSAALRVQFDAHAAQFQRLRGDETAGSFGAEKSSESRQKKKWDRRRSVTGANETCTTLEGADPVLQNNTHTFSFRVRTMGSLSLAWVGDGSGVLLVLTTFHVPLFMLRLGQSNLYRSKDYGKTFEDVTHLINHTFIQTEFGIAISPDHSGKVILTGDVSDLGGFKLFRSHDFGLNFDPTDLPFEPLIQMLFNPSDCDVLLTLSITLDLWLSEDFGATWRKIHDSVCLVR
ncbi:sortilin-like, partial [Eucyclogobius newberryi]|uniref:sortilin-like n=1 Tax=Eucyclogobius newberryi TaxID=166745 RepID=UPI003B597D9C